MKKWRKQGRQFEGCPWVSLKQDVLQLNKEVCKWLGNRQYVEIWYELDWTYIELRFFKEPSQDRYKLSRGRVCAKALLGEIKKRKLKVVRVEIIDSNRLGIWLR